MISPFFNASGGLKTEEWTKMWQFILSQTEIDIIALQDGIGVGHATYDQLSTWFNATKQAINRSGKSVELWADTETFIDESKPMPIINLVENMKAVVPYVDNFTSFSFLQYNSYHQTTACYRQVYQSYVDLGKLPDEGCEVE